jgi:hypothetical protein
MPAAVANRNDTALEAASHILTGSNTQQEAGTGCRDGVDVDALDTEQAIRPLTPAPARAGSSIRQIRVSFDFGGLVATNSMRPRPLFRRTTPQWHRPAPRRRQQPDLTMLIGEGPHNDRLSKVS